MDAGRLRPGYGSFAGINEEIKGNAVGRGYVLSRMYENEHS
jgi:hypothetical protein